MSERVEQYFRLAVQDDPGPYFEQFSDNAVVEDEGHEHRGIEAIRRWRTSVPPVVYTVVSVDENDDRVVARASISGDFPGSPVLLTFAFVHAADGRIDGLTIRV